MYIIVIYSKLKTEQNLSICKNP